MLTEINYKGDIIMEQMGIVRRLDALGRVVIPREFRKLNHIEVGDPLEIRALANGDILVRKVDLSAQLRSIGAIALSSLAPHTHNTVGVCTPEEWLMFSAAVSGLADGTELGEAAKNIVAAQKNTVVTCAEAGISCKKKYAAFYPAYGDTGVFGALVMFADEQPTESENVLMDTVARFVGKSMQNF